MNDSAYKSYFQKRLSNFQSDRVPEFDQLFTQAELSPVPLKSTSFRLWPVMWRMGSAAAIITLVLLLWPKHKQTDLFVEDVKKQASEIQPEASYEVIPTLDEQLLYATRSKPLELESEAKPSVKIPVDQVPTSDITVMVVQPEVEIIPHETASDSGQKVNDADIHQGKSVITKEDVPEKTQQNNYKRSIQEAHKLAVGEAKQKNKSGKPRLGFAINQNNGLLASVSPNNYQSMVASMTDGYQEAYTILNAGSLMRSGNVSPNTWEKPGNLEIPVVEKPKYHFPLNLSFSLSFPLSKRVEIQTGLSYSYLTATTQGVTNLYNFTLFQELHYLGIPLKIAYRIIDNERFGMYASIGGSLEKGLTGRQKNTLLYTDNRSDVWTGQQNVYGIQPIAGIQLGFEYSIIPKLDLYVEPGAVYYFDTDQPLSIRTKSPLFFNLGLGLRYRL